MFSLVTTLVCVCKHTCINVYEGYDCVNVFVDANVWIGVDLCKTVSVALILLCVPHPQNRKFNKTGLILEKGTVDLFSKNQTNKQK